VLDLSPLVPKFRDEAIKVNPAYAQLMPAKAPLQIQITDRAPDLTGLKRSLDRRFSALALASAGLIAFAMLIHSRRPTVLRRIGVWLIAFALLQGAFALLLPVLASGLPGNSSIIGEHLARSLMPRLIAPAVALMLFGVGAFICARRWQRLHDERNERTGANAFLDPDHLIKISGTGAPLATAVGGPFTAPGPGSNAASVFDNAPPVFEPILSSPRPQPKRERSSVKTPNSPAALFDPVETRSPPVDSRQSLSRTIVDLGALPTTHRGDD